MASIEERLRQLADENLEVDGQPIGKEMDPSKSLFDLGLSSLDIVAFGKVIAQEFNVPLTPEKGRGDAEHWRLDRVFGGQRRVTLTLAGGIGILMAASAARCGWSSFRKVGSATVRPIDWTLHASREASSLLWPDEENGRAGASNTSVTRRSPQPSCTSSSRPNWATSHDSG